MTFSIWLAAPRGTCAGVRRSLLLLDEVLRRFPNEPIFVKHHIVHNTQVVASYEARGITFVERIDEIPTGSIAVFSAHGSSPSDFVLAAERKLRVIDSACPLVAKVHTEAKMFLSQGYSIIYIGTKTHAEAIGVHGEGPDSIFVVHSPSDVDALAFTPDTKLALLTQTTLSVDDTTALIAYIQNKYPSIVLPKKDDICYATQNRQTAIKALAAQCDTIFVVGSSHSSNSNKLRQVAETAGAKAFLIDTFAGITPDMLDGAQNV